MVPETVFNNSRLGWSGAVIVTALVLGIYSMIFTYGDNIFMAGISLGWAR